MLRRIMIILAATMAALALATAPAGAGAGNLELYAETGYGKPQGTVSATTLQTIANSCKSVSELTSLTLAQSADNFSNYSIAVYENTGCTGLLDTIPAQTSVESFGGEARSIYVS
jgi:hypothetical protein